MAINWLEQLKQHTNLCIPLFRSLNRENFGQLVIQMTGSLLFLNVCTLVGYNRYQIDDNTVCMVVAVLTHYFALASLFWSAVAAHFVFRNISMEYAVQERIFLCKRFLFAWGKSSPWPHCLSIALSICNESLMIRLTGTLKLSLDNEVCQTTELSPS